VSTAKGEEGIHIVKVLEEEGRPHGGGKRRRKRVRQQEALIFQALDWEETEETED